MTKIEDILDQMRSNPKGDRIQRLMRSLRAFFWNTKDVGSSHRVFRTPWQGDPRVNIQNSKEMAKAYQVKQVLMAIERLEVQRGKRD